MRKYLFLLAGLLLTFSISDVQAKAVKLGRDTTIISDTTSNIGETTSTTHITRSCPNKQRQSGDNCIPICTDVTCATGYRPEAKNTQCCCVKKCSTGCANCNETGKICYTCSDGYRLIDGKCVQNCSGVECKVGFIKRPTTAGCCCVKKVCPANCSKCSDDGVCTTCSSGYTLSDGLCTKGSEPLPTCPANCSTCNSSGVCTKCANNYILQNGSCVLPTCPAHCSSCNVNGVCTQCANGYKLTNGSCTQITCSAGYYNNNGTCTACTGMYYSLGGTATSCTACSTYTSSGSNTCTSCSNTTGECTGSNGGSSSGGSSSGGSSGCRTHSQCPSGYECTGGNGCQKCSSGSNLSYENCNCPAGQYSTGNGSCSYAKM